MTDSATPDAAAVLYGSTPPAPAAGDAGTGAAAPTAPAATAPASPAPASGDAPPPDRDETPDAADILFNDPVVVARNYEPTLADSLDALTALAPDLAEKRDALLAGAAEVFADAALPPERASLLYSLYVSSLQNPPDEATSQQWATDSITWLQEQFPQGHTEQLNRARQFIQARPELKEMLERTGLGNNLQVVKALIENASQLRLAPRKR